MSSSSISLLQRIAKRSTNPPILPIPSTTTGNNVPKSLHKTRRTWKPNTSRYDLPAPLLLSSTTSQPSTSGSTSIALSNGLGESSKSKLPEIKGVKMQTRRIKDVDKAGSVEGMLLSRPSKHFTPFGQKLRHQLFNQLHAIRTQQLVREVNRMESGDGGEEFEGLRLRGVEGVPEIESGSAREQAEGGGVGDVRLIN